MFKSLRNAFFAGLIILLPLGVTIITFNLLIKHVGTPSKNLFFWFLDPALRSSPWIEMLLEILSVIVVAFLITLLGIISRYFLGRMLLNLTEAILTKLPFISTVYNTVKQIVDTFSEQQKAVFQKVVLVEYPRKGVYVVGFLTSTSKGEIQTKTQSNVMNIFVPTTPNPTSGFLLMVPAEEIIYLDMSVSDGMKIVISGGAVVPGITKPSKKIFAKKIHKTE